MSNRKSVVHSDPEILGGTPVFRVHVCRYETFSTILSADTA